MAPATQLEHLQLPDMARSEPLVGQHHDPVDMGAEHLQLIRVWLVRSTVVAPRIAAGRSC